MSGDAEELKVNGPDDAIAMLGDTALWGVIDAAQLSQVSARRDAEEAIQALKAQRERAKSNPEEIVIPNYDEAIESISAINDEGERALFIGQMAAIRIPGLTKALIEKEVRREREALREELDAARKIIRHEKYMRVADSPLQLVRDLTQYYAARRALSPGAAEIEAVFCMNTYVFDVFDTVPYLLYDSATPGCGKTISLERHEAVCHKGYLCASPSSSVIFRRIDRDHGTFILDEAKWLQEKSDRAAEVTEIFDVGYKRGGKVSRCAEHGEGLVDFDVFCPKVMARIGNFTGTLLSRGVLFHLTKAYGLPQSFSRVIKRLAAPLKERLEAYAMQNRKALEEMYEAMPDQTYWEWISGRENELYTPLLMHARLIATVCGKEGQQFETEFMDIVRGYTAEKVKLTITEDWRVGEALEVLEVLENPLRALLRAKDHKLEKWQDAEVNRIAAGALLEQLLEKEIWGAYLERKKSDKAKATAIGTFLRSFGPTSRHTETGTQYELLDLAKKLASHVPPELPEPLPGSTNSSAENFRTLLKQFEENLPDTSFPEATDTSFPGPSQRHIPDPAPQKGFEVSACIATSSAEKAYELTPSPDSASPEVSAKPEVSADDQMETDTLTREEFQNFGGVSQESLLNEDFSRNPDTSTGFLGDQQRVEVTPEAEVFPGAGKASPGTKEMFPDETQLGDKRDSSAGEPNRSDDIEGYL